MSLADNTIDSDIGPLWAKHYPKREDVGSKTVILALVYIIEDRARASATTDWSDRVSRELRRYRIPADEFWEIYSAVSR